LEDSGPRLATDSQKARAYLKINQKQKGLEMWIKWKGASLPEKKEGISGIRQIFAHV
jgi:hypothetical protein